MKFKQLAKAVKLGQTHQFSFLGRQANLSVNQFISTTCVKIKISTKTSYIEGFYA